MGREVHKCIIQSPTENSMSVQIQENGLKVPPNQKLDVDKHMNEIFGQLVLLGDNTGEEETMLSTESNILTP